jgi:hypothetical protein
MSELTVAELEALVDKIDGEGPPPSMRPSPAVTAKSDSPLALKEFVDATQLKKDVEFDPNDLDNAVRQHAALFIHYANLARLARRQFERMKAAAEIMESKLAKHHREALMVDGKKTTEAMIDGAVKCDPRWFATQQKLIDARAIYELANDAREAFAQRRDMIVQVSVDRRREKEGALRVMQDPAADRARVLENLSKGK